MRSIRSLLLIVACLSASSIIPPVHGADVYQGRVVDDASGQPLVGAVITVVWFRSPIVGLEGTRDFQSAQEAVVDTDGKFYLPVSPGSNWNPLSYIREAPTIIIYHRVTNRQGPDGWLEINFPACSI